ncbi:transposase [Streptomyces sp. BK340]|uniref:transposase n=1 Tax=Streptomyces sp. BK340 TaxID=2572903 RepID=UPI0011ADE77F|nr:DDE family transposase [Streptomyces sp. BK340]
MRKADGRSAEPSSGPLDSQSIRTADTVPGATRGFGAGKKVKGRKRSLVTDTLGLVIAVRVVAASVQDRDGPRRPLLWARVDHPRIQRFWADQGFAGRLARLIRALLSVDPAHRPDSATAERTLELTQCRDTPARGIHLD